MFYLGQAFMQLWPLFLLFEEIPSSVCESCRICGFLLRTRKMRETDYEHCEHEQYDNSFQHVPCNQKKNINSCVGKYSSCLESSLLISKMLHYPETFYPNKCTDLPLLFVKFNLMNFTLRSIFQKHHITKQSWYDPLTDIFNWETVPVNSPPALGRVSSFPPTGEPRQKALCDPHNAASSAGSQHHAGSTALQ